MQTDGEVHWVAHISAVSQWQNQEGTLRVLDCGGSFASHII